MSASIDIERAVDVLRRGRLIGLPTETVYGLAADAANEMAVGRIYSAKGRPAHNPLIAHLHDAEAVADYVVLNNIATDLSTAFWPGPLTLVCRYRKGVTRMARAGLETLAVRIPAHPVAQSVLAAFGGALVAPSANVSGRLSPTRAADVSSALGAAVDMVLDGGPTEVGLESTIVDCTDERPVLLRPGGVTREALEAVVGPFGMGTKGVVKAPGALSSHYAPRARVRMNAGEPRTGEAWLGFGETVAWEPSVNLSASADLDEAARNLFSALRELDRTNVETIAVQPIPEAGLGSAINDRLRRAAADRGNAS